MSLYPFIHIPKLVLLRPTEHGWIKNVLKITTFSSRAKDSLLTWKPRARTIPSMEFLDHPRIIKDGHSVGSMIWTLYMARLIMKNGSKIRKHKHGHTYI